MIPEGSLDGNMHYNQVRIQDLGNGRPQLVRPKVANIAEWSHASEANYLWPGPSAHLRFLEAFEFLMLKYAFSHILETHFLSFLIFTSRPKIYN